MELKVELSTGGRDHYCLSVCKELEFSVVKALSNLSLKIQIGSTELPAFSRIFMIASTPVITYY